VRAQLLACPQFHFVGTVQTELGPVNGAVFQVLQPDALHGWLLVHHRLFGMLAKLGGGHNHATGKWLFARGREKAVNVSLLNRVPLCIELALNGTKFARVEFLRHKVNACVGLVAASWPFTP